MKFGLEDRHWKLIEQILIGPLKAKGAEIWIFGSRARGNHQPFSDLDVLYRLPPQAGFPPSELAAIHEALEESTLPFKVDLVAESDLALSYQGSIFRDRVPI